MTETMLIVACAECKVFWSAASVDPLCGEAGHHHKQHELHRHRTQVTFPDGTGVVAVSFDEAAPYERDIPPAFGLYLDRRWTPPWAHDHVAWPDFGVPADPAAFREQLGDVLVRARAGNRVEIGCLGAHGRTGTALACLAALCGHPAAEAVAWVRDNYCEKAIETDAQAAFVVIFANEK